MAVYFLEQSMHLEDAWGMHNFATILAIHNSDLGDEHQFRTLMCKAIEAGILKPIPRAFDPRIPLTDRDFLFHPRDLLNWAINKKLNVGTLSTLATASMPVQDNASKNNCKKISKESRDACWQEECDRIQAAHPMATKTAIAEYVLNHFLKNDPIYVTKEDGTIYPTSTIERSITVKKTGKIEA